MYSYYYKKIAPLMVMQVLSYFMINIVNMYLTRIMGYSIYGDYSLALLILFGAAPFFACGTTFIMVKELPKLINKGNKKQQYIFLKWNFSVILKSCLVIMIFIILSYVIQYYLKENPHCLVFENCRQYRHLFRDVFYSLPFVLLILWNSSFLNANQHNTRSQLLGIANFTYVIALIFIIADFFLIAIEHHFLLIAIFLACFILLAIQYLSIFLLIHKNKQYSYKKLAITSVLKKDRLRYRHSALGMMYNQIMYVFMGVITMTMLELSSHDEVVVGHYSASLYIVSIIGAFSMASGVILQPWLSAAFDKTRGKKLQSLIYLSQITGTIYYLITIALFFTFKNMIYKAYKLNYPHITLTIFSIFTLYFIFTLFSFPERLCIYNNLNRKLLLITFMEIILLILGCYVMIPHWSILGAILASFIAGSWAIIASFYILKKSGSPIKTLIFW